jgi:hypothetical protein
MGEIWASAEGRSEIEVGTFEKPQRQTVMVIVSVVTASSREGHQLTTPVIRLNETGAPSERKKVIPDDQQSAMFRYQPFHVRYSRIFGLLLVSSVCTTNLTAPNCQVMFENNGSETIMTDIDIDYIHVMVMAMT